MLAILVATSSLRARSSSNSTSPTTSRIVVCAIFMTLSQTFRMFTTLSFVLTIFMKTTASTVTLMLSLVITSCREMSRVVIRLSCFRKVSTYGHLKKNPGPTSLWNLPNRSIIASSHSLLIANVAGRGNRESTAKRPQTKAVGLGYVIRARTKNSKESITKKTKGAGEREYSVVFSPIFKTFQ